eukprot:TRINITY_DN455_c0_g2_i1.p1 TRINITY_DN455_c0_g2~~TRINITY_DN455_c0_g2_i1.p1  ORF type:complete len:348 (+),score=111.50 TRINITY_DN455_c0_g2_i1:69-1112(+)
MNIWEAVVSTQSTGNTKRSEERSIPQHTVGFLNCNMGDSDDLDDLLDSALEDYQKIEKEKEEKTRTLQQTTTTTIPSLFSTLPSSSSHIPNALNTTTTTTTTTTSSTTTTSTDNAENKEDEELNEDEIAKQFAEEVSKIMSDLKEGKIDNLLEQLNSSLESGANLEEGEEGDSNAGGFEQNLTSTLSSLANEIKPDANRLPEMGDDYLDKLQGGLEGLVESLISKDVLYEPMKELREKYPPWLESHKDKLSEEEFTKYNKQYECVQKICVIFENNQSTLEIVQLVQEMSEFGQPPSEIMEELAPGVKFGADGLPILPDESNENSENTTSNNNNPNAPPFNPDNCLIM